MALWIAVRSQALSRATQTASATTRHGSLELITRFGQLCHRCALPGSFQHGSALRVAGLGNAALARFTPPSFRAASCSLLIDRCELRPFGPGWIQLCSGRPVDGHRVWCHAESHHLPRADLWHCNGSLSHELLNQARYAVKMDHKLAVKDQLNGTYIYDNGDSDTALAGGSNTFGPDLPNHTRSQAAGINWAHTFTPTFSTRRASRMCATPETSPATRA